MPTARGRRKVCVVVASRASYARIKSVLTAAQGHPDLQLQLVVSASALLHRFGKVVDVIQRDGFPVEATVYNIVEGENPTTMAKSTGLAISELATIFENMRPDVVLTVADRFETLGTAVATSYMNIPLAHTQGGEVTGSIDESVRHAVTKLAHVHFPATKLSSERLTRMGEDPATVFLTGCPSIDAIANLDLSLPDDLFVRYGGVGAQLDPREPYIVVMQHPVTTEYGQGLAQVNETLAAVAELKMPTVWLWPNVDAGSDDVAKGLRMFRERYNPTHIQFFRNFSVEDYARVIDNCACLVGNSSSAIREGSFLGVPAVNVGTRQQGRERGENVVDVAYSSEEILKAIRAQIAHGRHPRNHLYGDGRAGERIADILAGFRFTIQKRLAY
ncbi:MAG: UDP-N-acetylglucosamine 2-epimerase (hydrolyzing) [Candidatus Rokubacteria bacterium]|nr:UDP-N-acetylglucosamine 2-epimerase (hydrolyzing) [Candidatus Rokubacteria bacterium]